MNCHIRENNLNLNNLYLYEFCIQHTLKFLSKILMSHISYAITYITNHNHQTTYAILTKQNNVTIS